MENTRRICTTIKKRNQYLNEFKVLNSKTCTKMKQLTPYEILIFRKLVLMVCSGCDSDDCICRNPDKFFDENYRDCVCCSPDNFFDENYDFWADCIDIVVWSWTHDGTEKILVDIFSWPGDNQSGGIFDGDIMVFENSDRGLTATEACPNDLKERLLSFEEIRTM